MNTPRLPSGLWDGYYEQGGQYPQKMNLEFADGLMRGDGVDKVGTFIINGEYRIEHNIARLGWIKTYDGSHSVLYLGTLKNNVIQGNWSIDGWGSTFELSYQPNSGL